MSSDQYYIRFDSAQKPWPMPQFYVVDDEKTAVVLCQRLERYFSKLKIKIQYTFRHELASKIGPTERFIIDQTLNDLATRSRNEPPTWLEPSLEPVNWYYLARKWHEQLSGTSPDAEHDAEQTATEDAPVQKPQRGRPYDTDWREDKKITAAWDSGYKTYAECARELGNNPRGIAYKAKDIRRALDRRRHREQRRDSSH